MAYKIIVSTHAKKEIEDAIDYYLLFSKDAPKTFVTNLEISCQTLEKFPFFKIRYKNLRAIKIRELPYSLYFIIMEERKTVRILSCFHHKLKPW
jgi:toxin ParE1/3/4